MKNLIARFVREDEGQDLIEYAILIGLIAVGVVAVVGPIGDWVLAAFTKLKTDLGTPIT